MTIRAVFEFGVFRRRQIYQRFRYPVLCVLTKSLLWWRILRITASGLTLFIATRLDIKGGKLTHNLNNAANSRVTKEALSLGGMYSEESICYFGDRLTASGMLLAWLFCIVLYGEDGWVAGTSPNSGKSDGLS